MSMPAIASFAASHRPSMSEDLITSLYPPPPPYYRFFTGPNLERFQELKQQVEASGETADSLDSEPSQLDTPELAELRFQVPPKIPKVDQYRGYGSVWSLKNEFPSLKDLGWKQLYADEDEAITSKAKIEELHKLLDSLLLNFLELVATMSVEPAKFHVKIEHLKLILINMNHLLNTYRPHQTRESLIMLLETQIEEKKTEVGLMVDTVSEIKEKIRGLVADYAVESETLQTAMAVDEREKKLEELRALLSRS